MPKLFQSPVLMCQHICFFHLNVQDSTSQRSQFAANYPQRIQLILPISCLTFIIAFKILIIQFLNNSLILFKLSNSLRRPRQLKKIFKKLQQSQKFLKFTRNHTSLSRKPEQFLKVKMAQKNTTLVIQQVCEVYKAVCLKIFQHNQICPEELLYILNSKHSWKKNIFSVFKSVLYKRKYINFFHSHSD